MVHIDGVSIISHIRTFNFNSLQLCRIILSVQKTKGAYEYGPQCY